MLVEELVKPETVDTDDSDDLDHLYCGICDPEAAFALCGTDLTDSEDCTYKPGWGPDCVVCIDLNKTHECKENNR